MQKVLNKIKFLVGSSTELDEVINARVLPVFNKRVLVFLSKLSKSLMKDKRVKDYPDVFSFAFWIREKSMIKIKSSYDFSRTRVGKGLSFHIAPSNVPVNFAVSMTYSLLTGNSCIIRVSNKNFDQIKIIVDNLNHVISETNFENRIIVVRYDHDDEISEFFSSHCDIRIIWGGDNTINKIRNAKIPPRTTELCFSDRHSISIINSDEYLLMDEKKIANDFYIDTFFTDQNACSSPRLVIWTGSKSTEARTKFWKKLEDVVFENNYEFQKIQGVDKLSSICNISKDYENIKLISENNLIFRLEVKKISKNLMSFKEGGGYFFEHVTKDLTTILPVFSKPCQTIGYLGEDPIKLKSLVLESGCKGVDRIVKLGSTMNISLNWDGYDMIEAMSRIVYTE